MTYPLPAPPSAAQPARGRRSPREPNGEGGKYTPLWLILAALLILMVSAGRLLSRPVGQWAAALQPTATATPSPTPTLTATSTPTPRPTATPAAVEVTPTMLATPLGPALPDLTPGKSLFRLVMKDELRGWGQAGGRVWRTVDGALSWQDVTPADLMEGQAAAAWAWSFFLNDRTAWLLEEDSGQASMARMFSTQDGGLTWSAYRVPFGLANLFFLDASNGWALSSSTEQGRVELYRTRDGGRRWTPVYRAQLRAAPGERDLPSFVDLNGPVFQDPQDGWVSASDLLYRTLDGGKTWGPVDVGLESLYPGSEFDIYPPRFFGPEGQAGVLPVSIRAGGADAGGTERSWKWAFFFTSDGGERWQPSDAVRVENRRVIFNILSPREIVVMDGDQLLRTTDGAQTWEGVSTSLQNIRQAPEHDITVQQVQFTSRRAGWAWGWDYGNVFRLYRTQDGGRSWQAVRPRPASARAEGCDREVVALDEAVETETGPGPYRGWSRYRLEGGVFSFHYPPGWRLLEMFETCPGLSARRSAVMLLAPRGVGGYLVIGFRRALEQANITFPLPRAGTLLPRGSAPFLGQEVVRAELAGGGETRAVYWAMGDEIYVDGTGEEDYYFTLTLLGGGEPGAESPLPADVLALADQVVGSFQETNIP